MNILFTSAGRRVELLKAFRAAYRSLQLDGKIIALDSDPLAPALHFADCPYIVPRLSSPDYLPTLLGICERERVGAIFPLIDNDIPVLAGHRPELEATGARLAVPTSDATKICADKWLTKEWFQRLGLATPRGWLPGEIDAETADYPLFIKPREGSAAANTFKVHNAQELAFFSSYVPCPLIEEFLPGPEITSDVICDLEGNVLTVVSRRRIEVRWGEVAKGTTVYDPAVTEACVAIARGLPAIGPITAQCLMKDGRPHFTEVNARLGGGVPLGIASGADSPRWLLARLAGIDMEIPPMGSYRTGCYMTRFDESLFLSEADYATMESHRL